MVDGPGTGIDRDARKLVQKLSQDAFVAVRKSLCSVRECIAVFLNHTGADCSGRDLKCGWDHVNGKRVGEGCYVLMVNFISQQGSADGCRGSAVRYTECAVLSGVSAASGRIVYVDGYEDPGEGFLTLPVPDCPMED